MNSPSLTKNPTQPVLLRRTLLAQRQRKGLSIVEYASVGQIGSNMPFEDCGGKFVGENKAG